MKPLFQHPKIVVTIPAFNEEKYIAEAINSLKAQDWTDFSAVIFDNASTDLTGKVCHAAIGADPRFKYLKHPENCGSAANYRYAFENTESPYFMWLGAHDKLDPVFLSSHIRALDSHPECSLSYSLTQWIDESGNEVKITDPSAIGDLQGRPLARYFGAVRRMKECTAVNNVLRRSAMGRITTWNVRGFDMLLLSEMLFWGPAHRVDQPLYFRREFAHRSSDYAERLTGQAGITPTRDELAEAYMRSFDRLVRQPERALTRKLFASLLRRRLTSKFVKTDWFYIAATRALGL